MSVSKVMLWVGWLVAVVVGGHAAILPPPWADPNINPCASQPGGWLKLYWPKDGQCYRIFQRGAPCPDTMELSPGAEGAECRCPPGQVQLSHDSQCHKIHTKGPCDKGQYLAPVQQSVRGRWGDCQEVPECNNVGEMFWAATKTCYPQFTRGPCPLGQLLVYNNGTGLAECTCSSSGDLSRFYWPPAKSCHQLYTRGPCLEKGALFLPGPKCGCHTGLPNFHPPTGQCYEIGGTGPCKSGHIFKIPAPGEQAECICKPDHVPWLDGHCYRLYTQGPCLLGQLVSQGGTCEQLPCPRGKLFFPEQNACHRVGVRGPCPRGQLVLFEQSVRPAVEGISYRGMCGCSGSQGCMAESPENQARNKPKNDTAESTKIPRHAHFNYKTASLCEDIGGNQVCHKLYTQGPCQQGEWLVPYRQSRSKRRAAKIPGSVGVYIGLRLTPTPTAEPLQQQQPLEPRLFQEHQPPEPRLFQDELPENRQMARCECRPGFSKGTNGCRVPLIALAKYLNGADYFQ